MRGLVVRQCAHSLSQSLQKVGQMPQKHHEQEDGACPTGDATHVSEGILPSLSPIAPCSLPLAPCQERHNHEDSPCAIHGSCEETDTYPYSCQHEPQQPLRLQPASHHEDRCRHQQEGEGVIVESDEDGGKQKTDQNGHHRHTCWPQIGSEGTIHTGDGKCSQERFQHSETKQSPLSKRPLPAAAQQSSQIEIEVERNGIGMLKEVLVEGHAEPHVDGIEPLQT